MPYDIACTDAQYLFLLALVKQRSRSTAGKQLPASCQSALKLLESAKHYGEKEKPVLIPIEKRDVKVNNSILCSDHPNYTARRRPRTDCKTCSKAYANKNPDRLKDAEKVQ